MSWLEDHLENFVLPQISSEGQPFDNLQPLGYFRSEELTIIKNQWRAVKRSAEGRTILLPGRDVFVFEILARREDYPTIFMPECSRMTVHEIAKTIDKELFLFDTGFAGSIPRGLGIQTFKLMSYRDMTNNVAVQVFPRLSFSRGLALKIEASPKYWESGRIVDDCVLQPFSHHYEFLNAARLTIEVYKNSAPKFIKKHHPMRREGIPPWMW
ncbi:MAG TPA: hypothetical protein VGE97_09405 [Nitrososphaera sp.]|jgi:hypothetical protein